MLQPRATWVACGQKGKQVAKGTTKTKVGNKRCLYNKIINKCGKDVQNTETGAPVVNEFPRGGINVVKTDEGWGPHWRVSV
jgi:hypothetical protein